MDILMSFAAGAWIRERGGSLYLWDDDFGNFGIDRLATSPPLSVEFDAHYAGEGVTVHIDHRLELPDRLRLETPRWPHRKLRVYWNDRHWGPRGEGGGGGNGGG